MSKLRLLICHSDKSVTPLPWCGEDNQCQHAGCLEPLEYRLGEHIGHRVDLADIEEEVWKDPARQKTIIAQAVDYTCGTGNAAGLGGEFYNVRDTFREDAMSCWRKHNRTKDCADWRTDRMRLYPDTKADRKELGLDPKTRPTSSLCDFCVVTSVKMQRMRKDRYGYNYSD